MKASRGSRGPSVAGRAPVEQLAIPVMGLAVASSGAVAAPAARERQATAPAVPVKAALAPFVFSALRGRADVHNRGRGLYLRQLGDGRTWLDVLGRACLHQLVSLEGVLAGERSPGARAAREAALAELLQLAAGEEHEVAAALGIADHRARRERDRTGGTG
jgi:hypothetical protein